MGRCDAMRALTEWANSIQLATPCWLYLPTVAKQAVRRMKNELGARISYATKANTNLMVLRDLAPLVDEFNVTNIKHMDDLLRMQIHPKRIMFLHPASTLQVIRAASDRGISRFVVDDNRGLELIKSLRRDVSVTIRVLPPQSGESERSIVRFGCDKKQAVSLAREARDAGIAIDALSFFIGTDHRGMDEAAPYREGLDLLQEIAAKLRSIEIDIKEINIGGGFPGSQSPFFQKNPYFFTNLYSMTKERFPKDTAIACEPGRYLCESSVMLLSRVVSERKINGRRLIHIDASSYGGLFDSTFIEPGGATIDILTAVAGDVDIADVVGPNMDSFDVIKRNTPLPAFRGGELLLIPNVGAYSWSYSTFSEGIEPYGYRQVPADLEPEVMGAFERVDAVHAAAAAQ